jgi:hypothetical protein
MSAVSKINTSLEENTSMRRSRQFTRKLPAIIQSEQKLQASSNSSHNVLIPQPESSTANDVDPGDERRTQAASPQASSLEYTCLKPDSNQIRILFVDGISTDSNKSWMSFTLKTVDFAARVSLTKQPSCSPCYPYWDGSEQSKKITASMEQELGSPIPAPPPPVLVADEDLNDHVQTYLPPYLTAAKTRFHWGDYYAMSYVWGGSREGYSIIINDCLFPVRENLYLLLSELWLRHSYEMFETGYWIDAICINQQDLEERAREVKKMKMICSEALEVRAWLTKHTVVSSTH